MTLQLTDMNMNRILRQAKTMANEGDMEGAMKLCGTFLSADSVQQIANGQITLLQAIHELTRPSWGNTSVGIDPQSVDYLRLSDRANVAKLNKRCANLIKKFKPSQLLSGELTKYFKNNGTVLDRLQSVQLGPFESWQWRNFDALNIIARNLKKLTFTECPWRSIMGQISRFANLEELEVDIGMCIFEPNCKYPPAVNIKKLVLVSAVDAGKSNSPIFQAIDSMFPNLKELVIKNPEFDCQHSLFLHKKNPNVAIYYNFSNWVEECIRGKESISQKMKNITLSIINPYAYAQFMLELLNKDLEAFSLYLELHFGTEPNAFNAKLDELIEYARKNPVTRSRAHHLLAFRK